MPPNPPEQSAWLRQIKEKFWPLLLNPNYGPGKKQAIEVIMAILSSHRVKVTRHQHCRTVGLLMSMAEEIRNTIFLKTCMSLLIF